MNTNTIASAFKRSLRSISAETRHHLLRSDCSNPYFKQSMLLAKRGFASKKEPEDIFTKTEKFDDATHPRQRADELKAAQWATESKNKIKTVDKKYLEDSVQDLSFLLDHPIWSEEEVLSVQTTHRKPVLIKDYLAFWSVQALRAFFDFCTGYKRGKLTFNKVLYRVVFLETVAAVPGMVGAMIRHLHSLRLMKRDYGWIHTLLEEAENERMHLLSAIKLSKPGYITRLLVLLAQGVFVNFWFVTYLISPKFCHRFVGYLEEEAVKTYTNIINKIDDGTLKELSEEEAPLIAKSYWRLKENASLKDMFLAIRADEMHHREVNHELADRNPTDANPWVRRKL